MMVDKKSIYRAIFRAEVFLKCLALEVGTHDKLVSVKNISELFSKRRQLVWKRGLFQMDSFDLEQLFERSVTYTRFLKKK